MCFIALAVSETNMRFFVSVEQVFNPFPNNPWFLRVFSSSLLKTLWEKEKLLVTSNFSFSNCVFYPFEELSAIFIKFEIFVCILLQFGSLKFVVWERVKIVGKELAHNK